MARLTRYPPEIAAMTLEQAHDERIRREATGVHDSLCAARDVAQQELEKWSQYNNWLLQREVELLSQNSRAAEDRRMAKKAKRK
jgi:hypothetical protein